MPADTLLTAIRAHLDLPPTHKVIMEPIQKGGSGRTILRIKPEDHPSYIGIHYTLDRSDNANFLPVAHFLKEKKIRVPEVIYDNIRRHVAIVEDLGDKTLLDLKDEPFETREPFYRQAFQQLDKLLYTRPPKDFELQPAFDEDLYKWEQDYFFEHFVETHLGKNADALRQDPALQALAKRLGSSAPNLVHRDFQSQNLMISEEKVYLIDFQGMRMGRQEYDLASLLYDPYLNHSGDEIKKLLALWEDVADDEALEPLLNDCAAQRLMQALGAYANLVENDRQDWFAQHIPAAVAHLKKVTADTPLEDALHPILP